MATSTHCIPEHQHDAVEFSSNMPKEGSPETEFRKTPERWKLLELGSPQDPGCGLVELETPDVGNGRSGAPHRLSRLGSEDHGKGCGAYHREDHSESG